MTAVIDGRQARWFGPLMIAFGVFAVGLGLWSVVTGGDPTIVGRILGGAFPALLGALFIVGGQMLAAPRGGVYVGEGRLELRGDGEDDGVSIPLTDLGEIGVHLLVERWGEVEHSRWICEGALVGGARVLLGESDDEHGLKHYAHRLTRAAGLPGPVERPPTRLPPTTGDAGRPDAVAEADGTLLVSVGSKGRLARTLWVSGLSMLVVGVVLLMDIANNDVMGFLFGPLLTALGLILLVLPLTKGRLVEHLRLFPANGEKPAELGHGYEAFGRRWGWRTVPLEADAWVRIRQRGLLGACVELVSGGRIQHIAGGVHHHTALDPSGLRWLASHLSERVAALAPPPSDEAPTPVDL